MVEQPVEQRRGHHAVTHHLGPGFEALVGGDDDGDLLIELADHVEEQVRLPLLDGRVADLVDDDQVRLHDPPDPVFGGLLHLRGLEKLDQVRHPLEADLVPLFHGRLAKSDGQMRLPDAGWAEEQKILLGVNPAAVEKVHRLGFSDPLDPAELKILKPLGDREVGSGHIPLYPPFDPEVDLRRKDAVQERKIRGFSRLRIVDQLIKHGRSPSTPIAVVTQGTTPRQKCLVGTLEDIVAKVKLENLKPPSVIIVGEVVQLRKYLRWFDR